MFPKFRKPTLPRVEGFEPTFGHMPAPVRQEHIPKAGYPGKFEKPHTHKPSGKMLPTKPRQHKRF